jgi:hypothetical protein
MDINISQERDLEKVNLIVDGLNKDLILYLNKYQASPDILYNVIPKFASLSFELLVNKLEIEKMELTDKAIREKIVSFLENITLKLLLNSEQIILDVINRKSKKEEGGKDDGVLYH